MDADGVIVDEERAPTDVSDEEAISTYKNMVTGELAGTAVAQD